MKKYFKHILILSSILFQVWILNPIVNPEYYVKQDKNVTVKVICGRMMGSGVRISKDGLILTCAHLFDKNSPNVVTISLRPNLFADASIVLLDPKKDLALLHADYLEDNNYTNLVDYLPLVGTDIYIVGHPFDLKWTVTRGIISGIREKDLIVQTDAVINPGNSGGPVFDNRGRCIGISESIFPGPFYTGQGFIIPSTECLKFVRSYIQDVKSKSIRRRGKDLVLHLR